MMPAAYPHQDGIWVDVFQQSLQLRRAGLHRRWTVSTALAGVGEQKGSQQTPRGQFRIRAAIGSQAIEHSVWVGRRETGECYTKELAAALPDPDPYPPPVREKVFGEEKITYYKPARPALKGVKTPPFDEAMAYFKQVLASVRPLPQLHGQAQGNLPSASASAASR